MKLVIVKVFDILTLSSRGFLVARLLFLLQSLPVAAFDILLELFLFRLVRFAPREFCGAVDEALHLFQRVVDVLALRAVSRAVDDELSVGVDSVLLRHDESIRAPLR